MATVNDWLKDATRAELENYALGYLRTAYVLGRDPEGLMEYVWERSDRLHEIESIVGDHTPSGMWILNEDPRDCNEWRELFEDELLPTNEEG